MPRQTDSNEPRDWLLFAEADLEAVRILAERRAAYPVCRSRLAEALEKTLKAELIRGGWRLMKTHDIERLRTELEERDPLLVRRIDACTADLSEAYFSGRYPGFDLEDEDWNALEGHLAAVSLFAREVRSRCDALAGSPGGSRAGDSACGGSGMAGPGNTANEAALRARRISALDRILAKVCAKCPACRTARAKGRGFAFWLVSRVERGTCPFCAAYERVTGRRAHEPAEPV